MSRLEIVIRLYAIGWLSLFFLQPQIVMYAKIAAIHGFDLGIDHEIAPKEAIAYAPLPEGAAHPICHATCCSATTG